MNKLFLKSIIYLTLLLLFGCKNDSKNNTLNLEEIRPKSAFKSNKNNHSSIDSNDVFLQEYLIDSVNFSVFRLVSQKNSSFLNRFPSKKNNSRTLFLTDTSIQINHESYEYIDSNQMKNAFFNWLDCNGKDCRSIKLYEETKIEPVNLLFIATSNSIDVFRSKSTFNPLDWVNFVRFSKKIKEFKFIIFQKKNQKAQWFEFENLKLILKKKK